MAKKTDTTKRKATAARNAKTKGKTAKKSRVAETSDDDDEDDADDADDADDEAPEVEEETEVEEEEAPKGKAAKGNPVEAEILAAAKGAKMTIKAQTAKETPADYRARVVAAANDLPDKVWDSLKEDTQQWINEGVAAIKLGDPVKHPVPPFPGDDADDAGDAPKGKGKAGKAAKSDGPTTRKRAGSWKEVVRLKIKHPKYSMDQVSAALEKKGMRPAAGTLKMYFERMELLMTELKEAGALAPDFKF